MPYAKTVITKIWDESSSTWVDGDPVLITKNSVSDCQEQAGMTLVVCASGRTYYVKQTLAQIEIFLNS